jgi:predicted RNase H-like HicB family nuclease
MRDSAKYVKIVEWSEQDGTFVGECPGIIGPCCHGDDEVEVYRELCVIVEEWIEIMRQDGDPLPPPTAGMHVAQKLVTVVA